MVFLRIMSVARYRFIVELSVIFISVWCGGALLIYYLEVGASRVEDWRAALGRCLCSL